MTFKQLEYFLAIAEAGSITKAAETVHVSLPPLSLALKSLEEEVGAQLFIRGKTGLILTEEGEILQKAAYQTREVFSQAKDDIRRACGQKLSSLRIGSISAVSNRILPRRISFFHRKYPYIALKVIEGSTPDLLQLLDSGKLDLCIVREPFSAKKRKFLPLYDEKLQDKRDFFNAVATPDFFDEKNQTTIPLIELKGRPIVIHSRYVPQFSAQCSKHQFVPEIICENHDVTSLLSWAEQGLAIAVIPYSSTFLANTQNVVAREIVAPRIPSQAFVVWQETEEPPPGMADMIELFTRPQELD